MCVGVCVRVDDDRHDDDEDGEEASVSSCEDDRLSAADLRLSEVESASGAV